MLITSRSISSTYWFWIIFTILSFLGIGISIRYFSQAFPIVHLNLTVNRNQALELAAQRAKALNLEVASYTQAAHFYTDEITKLYVELDAGGTQRFIELLDSHLYEPYHWQIRYFKQGSAHELLFSFTPDGKPYDFSEIIPEQMSGASLSSQEAQALAQEEATHQWGINFEYYKLIDSSQEHTPNNRMDHAFVYERTDKKLGEATYRLRLQISGDKLTGVIHFVKVPEDFLLRYKELRAANKGVASAAMIFSLLVYILGCCGIGLLILMRQQWVLWKQAFYTALIVSALSFLTHLNQIPLIWIDYDTAISMNQYLVQYIIRGLFSLVSCITLFSCIFAAAESLTRKAFGHHPQFWRIWSRDAASSYEILGRTIAGYLLVGFHLAFVVFLYIFSLRYLGWWVPSDQLINPNILATYFPWLSSITFSLQAGFVEECTFRALPLAAAALLGNRYGKRSVWIGITFVLQALVFGAAHATYPTIPAYARLIELIGPSSLFGAVYLIYGLLPAIFSHIFFDLIWLSLPLFVSDAPYALIHQLFIIIAALIPVLIIIYALWYKQSLHSLASSFYNRNWLPAPENSTGEQLDESPILTGQITKRKQQVLIIGGILGALLFIFSMRSKKEDIAGLTISRTEALDKARSTLTAKGISLEGWEVLAAAQTDLTNANISQQKFVWQLGGKEIYHRLIGSYLLPPHWLIRFVKFNGTISERTEEYRVILTDNGTIQRITHKLPETAAGKALSEQEARILAHQELQKTYIHDLSHTQEISAHSKQLPARRDWHFTFADKQAFEHADGQARIALTIAGDEVVDNYRFIHLPEGWERTEHNAQETRSIVSMISALSAFIGIIFLVGIVRYRSFSYRYFFGSILILLLLLAGNSANLLLQAIASFNTAEPFIMQLFIICAIGLVSLLCVSIFIGFITALGISSIRTYKTLSYKGMTFRLIQFSVVPCCAGLWALYYYFAPQTMPAWGTYQYLSYSVPSIGIVIDLSLCYFLITGCTLFFLTSLATLQRRYRLRWFSLFLVCFLTGFIAVGLFSSQTLLSLLLIQSLVAGILIYIIKWSLPQHEVTIVPSIIGGLLFVFAITQEALNVGPIPGMLAGLFIIGSLSYASTRLLIHLQTETL